MPRAEESLITDNLGLARSLAARWRGRVEGYELDDLFQECWLSLRRAAESWRPGKIPFGTFAYICLERRMIRLAEIARLVRVPRGGAATPRREPIAPIADPRGSEGPELVDLADFLEVSTDELAALIEAPPALDSPLAAALRGRFLRSLPTEDSRA